MLGKWFNRKKRQSLRSGVMWPKLPEAGFLSGRSAKVSDVDRGDAVFSQRTDDGFPVEPYPIDIPQYAIWRDEDGTKIPVVVVQAERHMADKDGDPIFGLRGLEGEAIGATAPEVELLGTAIPTR